MPQPHLLPHKDLGRVLEAVPFLEEKDQVGSKKISFVAHLKPGHATQNCSSSCCGKPSVNTAELNPCRHTASLSHFRKGRGEGSHRVLRDSPLLWFHFLLAF